LRDHLPIPEDNSEAENGSVTKRDESEISLAIQNIVLRNETKIVSKSSRQQQHNSGAKQVHKSCNKTVLSLSHWHRSVVCTLIFTLFY
jgi:hypothetical protein